MSTTYSNPKEMLGYIVVKFIDQQLQLLQNIPYDRRAVFAFYYQLRGLDVQLISFREDMKIILDDNGKPLELNYYQVIKEINEILRDNWDKVFAKDYEDFMGACYRWAELIASCYPKLGLVPESDTQIDDKRDNLIEPNEAEMQEEKEHEQPAGEYNDQTNTPPEPLPTYPVGSYQSNVPLRPIIREPVIESNPQIDAVREREKAERRAAYKLL